MHHACFRPIALCFDYTSWHFYAFPGTNLLTRCQSASSCFPLFLCFRKVTQKIFSELDETKPEVPIFSDTRQSPKQRRWRARRQAHHWVAPLPSSRATRWCGPLIHPLTLLFHQYNPSNAKTLNQSASMHTKFCSTAAIEDQFWRTEVSVLAPCRDGKLPPEPSPSTPPPSPSLLLSPMMRREYFSPGAEGSTGSYVVHLSPMV
jgi:hypothetical protein